ncbi:MAG: hypothetical protein AAF732_18535, partial [Pseudomonadota bacterium]
MSVFAHGLFLASLGPSAWAAQRAGPHSRPGVPDGWLALVVSRSRAVPAFGRALREGGATRRAAFAAWGARRLAR